MTHEHDFIKDLDGQVTCSVCGARDDEMISNTPTYRGFIPQLVEKELK